jgi:hypothetical protein
MEWMTWPVVVAIAAVAAIVAILAALSRNQRATEEVRDELRKQAGTYTSEKEVREARKYARLHNLPDPYPQPTQPRQRLTKAERAAHRNARLHNLPDPTGGGEGERNQHGPEDD